MSDFSCFGNQKKQKKVNRAQFHSDPSDLTMFWNMSRPAEVLRR